MEFACYVHPRNDVEYLWLKGGQYQVSLNQFMRQNLRTGDAVAVAGVSFGQQVILASRAVGPAGCVVAIDPCPSALLRARMNLSLNDFTGNVRLVSAGLAERSATVALGAGNGNVNVGSLIKPKGDLPFHVIVETLPQILERLHINKVDMFLLDVIGYEMPVLKGIDTRILPTYMTISIHPWPLEKTGTTLEDYTQTLEGLGYSCWTLEGTPPQHVAALRGCQLVAVRHGAPSPRWLDKRPVIPPGSWDRFKG